VTITGHTTKGYSLYFDLTGQNTKKQDKRRKDHSSFLLRRKEEFGKRIAY